MDQHCRDCRWWNGARGTAALCMKIWRSEAAYTIEHDQAGMRGNGSLYLVTGPDFGCSLFEQKPIRRPEG